MSVFKVSLAMAHIGLTDVSGDFFVEIPLAQVRLVLQRDEVLHPEVRGYLCTSVHELGFYSWG